MYGTLERIIIYGLHGKKNIDIRFEDNTLVLVGENGSGKTTFLQILFNILSGRWTALIQYRFNLISLSISGVNYEISYEQISKDFEKIDLRFLIDFPPHLQRKIKDLIRSGKIDRIPIELEKMGTRYGISIERVMRRLQAFGDQPWKLTKELQQKIEKIHQAINAQILYLPTYRRIERDLDHIFEEFGFDDIRRTRTRVPPPVTERTDIELVEFGMQDVDLSIRNVLENLKDFARENLNNLTLKYLGDVVNREYLEVGMTEIAQAPEETIRIVLDRIPEGILEKGQKDHLFDVINNARASTPEDEHSKIVCHYFLKLWRFQETLQEREKNISAFCELCSRYIVDKIFSYNSTNFSFSIAYESGEEIKLSDLSSGEKQIVSLFSHLYLSGKQRYFVLIDEPELSLSVPWQRRFLIDIHKGDFCVGLVAATHSPFIYENELKRYTHALGEYISIGGAQG